MTSPLPAREPTRQERRKAETRRRIVASAERLFLEKSYADTSLEEIAAGADVAVRTIYLHFDSKAAIMLSYFDDWLDAFVAAVVARPVDEPVARSVDAAVATLTENGWADRVEGGDARPHPLVEHLRSGPPDIAGHVLQRWLEAVSTMTDDAAARSAPDADPARARARAMAVLTFWLSSMSGAHERQRGAGPAAAGGLSVLAAITSGTL